MLCTVLDIGDEVNIEMLDCLDIPSTLSCMRTS